MNDQPETPFEDIEGAQEYLDLLAETIAETRVDVDAEIERVNGNETDRRKQALQLVSYKLAKLSFHISTSRRILNDLRTLRRLLQNERALEKAAEAE